jgi:hypothetical protein
VVTGCVAALAALAVLAGCKHEKKPEALTAPSATPSLSRYAIHDEDVPVPADFEDAGATITPENLAAELEKLEREVER